LPEQIKRSFIVHTSSLFGDFSSTKSVTPWLPTFLQLLALLALHGLMVGLVPGP
jgi:hypothetical protein